MNPPTTFPELLARLDPFPAVRAAADGVMFNYRRDARRLCSRYAADTGELAERQLDLVVRTWNQLHGLLVSAGAVKGGAA